MSKSISLAIFAALMFGLAADVEAQPRRGVGAGAAGVGVRPGVGVGAPGVGVARAPVARGIIATGRYIAVLPMGCVATTVGDAVLQKCGSTYYRAHGAQYEVVTVQ